MGFKTDIQNNVVDVGIELVDLFNCLNNSFVLCCARFGPYFVGSVIYIQRLVFGKSSVRLAFSKLG